MRKRNVQVMFRLDKEEAQIFEKKVRKTGLKKEVFLRHLVLGFEPREKPDKEFYNAMNQMSAIGNRINQIAAKANALNFIDERAYKKEADELLSLRNQMQEKFLLPVKT